MGLAVSTGLLAALLQNDPEGAARLAESFKSVNRVLRENDLPEHHEPDSVPDSIRRDAISAFPYSCLHYLRRAYAHRLQDEAWIALPLPAGEDPAGDPVLEEEGFNMESHLLCHSDCEGFYVPVDFPEPLFDTERELPGGILGSSQALRGELEHVAPALGITLNDGVLSDQEAASVNARAGEGEGISRELMVWICLYEACKESITHGTAICFT